MQSCGRRNHLDGGDFGRERIEILLVPSQQLLQLLDPVPPTCSSADGPVLLFFCTSLLNSSDSTPMFSRPVKEE